MVNKIFHFHFQLMNISCIENKHANIVKVFLRLYFITNLFELITLLYIILLKINIL